MCDKAKKCSARRPLFQARHYTRIVIIRHNYMAITVYGDLVQQSKSIKISMDHVTKQIQTGDLVRILVGRDKTIIRCLLV